MVMVIITITDDENNDQLTNRLLERLHWVKLTMQSVRNVAMPIVSI